MALGALLDKERTCLLSGDLSGALDLADQKASLADSVENLPAADPAQVASIRRKAERNGLLLKAAQDGLSAARDRIQAILMGVATRTYAADGTRTEIPIDRIGLERRA